MIQICQKPEIPKVLFVVSEQMGWKTYSSELRSVLRLREDIDFEVLPVPTKRFQGVFCKRSYMTNRDRLHRFFDPMSLFKGKLGEPIRDAVRRFRPDAIHFNGTGLAAALEPLKVVPSYTISLDITRSLNPRGGKETAWKRAEVSREAELLHGAAALFPYSQWASKSCAEDYFIDADRLTVIPPSIDSSRIGVRKKHKPNSIPKIIFIGNHFHRKGGHLLHKWVSGPLAGRCQLHVVSSDPAVKRIDSPNVVVHGRVDNDHLLKNVLPEMDLMCHPTQSDMSAFVIVEAAFAGVPSIASRVGGIEELIEDGQTGWLLSKQDDVGFINRLEEVLGNTQGIQNAGRRAKAHAMKNFCAQKNMNALVDRVRNVAVSELEQVVH